MSPRLRAAILPIGFLIAGLVGTAFLYRVIEGGEQRRLSLETEIMAEQVRLRLEAWIDARVGLTQHLGEGQFTDRADLDANFRRQARAYVDLYDGIQAINFIDPGGYIRIVVPAETNAPALDKSLRDHANPGVVLALMTAAESGRPARTPLIDLLQGGRGFAVYYPLTSSTGERLGFVNGVFRLQRLVDSCLGEQVLRDRFSFQLLDADGEVAYDRPDETGDAGAGLQRLTRVRIVDRDLTLRLSPKQSHLAASHNFADEILAVSGIALMIGLALALRTLLLRQEALRTSQAKYRLLVENQSDLVVKLDPRGCFLYVSPSFCETYGKREDELLGRPFLPFVHPEDRDRTLAALGELERPPHRSYNEQRALTRAGLAWQAWSNAAVLGRDGHLEAVVAVGRDITRRRQLEDKLAMSRKMQAVGQLAGGIAHDFNNLLQTMLGNLQFVVQDLRPTGQTAEDLKEIEKGIDRAIVLTRQLLAFNSQQGTQARLDDLNRVVEGALDEIRSSLRPAIQVEFSPDERSLPVRVDRSQIEQVLGHLCENADAAIDGPGRISVATGTRTITAEDCGEHPELSAGSYATLSVQDSGQGMTPEILERIFEPFFTTRPVGAGTGLGLATCYGLIHKLHGTILATSEPGVGSTFTVLLPLQDSGAATPRRPGVTDGNQETILLAEDDFGVRELAVRVLRRANYEVLVAADGQEAVELFAEHRDRIDLVMLDMVMPNLGGRETRDAIVAIRPDVPVLFASGYDPGTLATTHDLGPGENLLAKPYGIPDLLVKVREILDRAALADES